MDDCECTCYLSHDVKLTTKVQVSLEFYVVECCETNGKFVRFIFAAHAEPTTSSYRNAAEVLIGTV